MGRAGGRGRGLTSARTLLILCAGRGTRLEPLTAELPKCLVPLHGRPLLHWQIEAARAAGVERIVLAGGYRAEALAPFGLPVALNQDYATTNMVETLRRARGAIEGELLLGYGDVVWEPRVMEALLAAPGDRLSVIVDRQWRSYWEARFADPLADAETLRQDGAGRLLEIGGRPRTLDEVEAQYIGLTRWSEASWNAALDLFQAALEGRPPERPPPRVPALWYVTDLLQVLIDAGRAPFGVAVDGGWLEVDTPRDLRLAERVSAPRQGLLAIGARTWPGGSEG